MAITDHINRQNEGLRNPLFTGHRSFEVFRAATFVTQLVAGNRDAFAALYDRLGKKLYATAVQLDCTHQEAEDVVHDLFVELARHRHELSACEKSRCLYFHNVTKRCQPPPATKKNWPQSTPSMGF